MFATFLVVMTNVKHIQPPEKPNCLKLICFILARWHNTQGQMNKFFIPSYETKLILGHEERA